MLNTFIMWTHNGSVSLNVLSTLPGNLINKQAEGQAVLLAANKEEITKPEAVENQHRCG